MQSSVPGFEYPRSDLPANVHFIGMMPAQAPHGWTPPAWWGDLDGGRPLLHVTQGTVANASPELIGPALEGLAGEDVLVVVSTGGRPVEELGLGKLPANARVGTFLSYPRLLPRTAAMVTNGGYGGVQTALSYGVPLAVAGTTEDKPEVAARVAWPGAGVNLKTAAPTPAQIRDAVGILLEDQRYRARAQALQAEYARYDALTLGAELLERLAATGRPVLREQAANVPQMARAVAGSI
jgi:UDP:flavonoid glycosyltransferase YjiC (YdhE family)